MRMLFALPVQALARRIGALDYLECSALSGEGVDDVIDAAMWTYLMHAQTERGQALHHARRDSERELCSIFRSCLLPLDFGHRDALRLFLFERRSARAFVHGGTANNERDHDESTTHCTRLECEPFTERERERERARARARGRRGLLASQAPEQSKAKRERERERARARRGLLASQAPEQSKAKRERERESQKAVSRQTQEPVCTWCARAGSASSFGCVQARARQLPGPHTPCKQASNSPPQP